MTIDEQTEYIQRAQREHAEMMQESARIRVQNIAQSNAIALCAMVLTTMYGSLITGMLLRGFFEVGGEPK